MSRRKPSMVEKRKAVIRQLRRGYLDENGDWGGRDDVRTYLTNNGIRRLPNDQILVSWDDATRKQLEAEGYTICNPTARNGFRRTLKATDVEKMTSLATRRRTTRTRQLRDKQQLTNLATSAETKKIRRIAASRLDVIEKVEKLINAVEVSERIQDELLIDLAAAKTQPNP